MKICRERKSDHLTENFMKGLRSKKHLIIYGAGYVGKIVGEFLKNKDIPVVAYVVTILDQRKKLNGIPVYSLEEILKLYQIEDINFIIAATGMNQLSIKQELENRGVHACLDLSEILICKMIQENRKCEAEKAQKQKGRKRKSGHIIGVLKPGYLDTDYAEKRLIIDKIDGVSYIPIPKETARIPFESTDYEKRIETYRTLVEACYCPEMYIPEVELIHTFNTVCNINLPWCASFETIIPRVWPETEEEKNYFLHLVECVKRSNCKTLYALSRNAYEIQKNHLSTFISADDVEVIMKKTKILHPPQAVVITEEEFSKKHKVNKIHFIFIGRLFFIKGGREIIQALSKFEDRYDFKLTLISSFLHKDYFTNTSYEEMIRCKKLVKSKKWIEYYESLPNNMVLEKCKEATIGMLPSVAETYGYAVLEMQAAGCPVITTNIRAFPENNNQECGWICHLPVDRWGRCSERESAVWSKILQEELEKCLQEIFENPDKIKKKGIAALDRIRKFHDPDQYQKELKDNLLLL